MIEFLKLIFLIGIINLISFQLIINLLRRQEVTALNHCRKRVVIGYGLTFTVGFILSLLIGNLLGNYSFKQVNRLLIIILTMSVVGIIDDLIGSREKKGFISHFRTLFFKFQLTTGSLKALFSGLVVLLINLEWSTNMVSALINSLLILLSANFVNLLDVKPGRAWKVIIAITVLILIFQPALLELGSLILISSLIMFPFDLAGKGMMGDIGSNVLGGVVGYLMTAGYSDLVISILVFILLGVHLYTEYNSLSSLIKNNKLLFYLDQLGRGN